MNKIVTLIYLACASHGRRVQTQESDAFEPLVSLLHARHPETAFNPSSPGAHLPAHSAAPASSRLTGDPMMARQRRKASRKQKESAFSKSEWQEELEKTMAEVAEAKEKEAQRLEVMKTIDPDQPAGEVADFMYKSGVADILDKLDREMIGIAKVKERVRSIASMLVIDKLRIKMGLSGSVPSLHMSFTGSPGTGKTSVALRMGRILQRMGYCRSGHVVVAGRDDLVGQYVGHTAPKTKEMVKKSIGGILLVDEAYYLYNDENERDFGQESVEILLNVMSTMKEDVIVILAGYEELMNDFFDAIPGMRSRIGNHIDFPDYEPEELQEIGELMCRNQGMTLDQGAQEALREYLRQRKKMPMFANARTVRNAIDLARLAGSIRLFDDYLSGGGGYGNELPPDPKVTKSKWEREDLLPGWKKMTDPLDKTYYLNRQTGEAQREPPLVANTDTDEPEVDAPAPPPAPRRPPKGRMKFGDFYVITAEDIPTIDEDMIGEDWVVA